ncbi:hypothetical protein NXS19_001813 [Fusarium pseudograminearum]|nr:hypothetical protein NXS19_001813 [Fusarium pseudograminearum]
MSCSFSSTSVTIPPLRLPPVYSTAWDGPSRSDRSSVCSFFTFFYHTLIPQMVTSWIKALPFCIRGLKRSTSTGSMHFWPAPRAYILVVLSHLNQATNPHVPKVPFCLE